MLRYLRCREAFKVCAVSYIIFFVLRNIIPVCVHNPWDHTVAHGLKWWAHSLPPVTHLDRFFERMSYRPFFRTVFILVTYKESNLALLHASQEWNKYKQVPLCWTCHKQGRDLPDLSPQASTRRSLNVWWMMFVFDQRLWHWRDQKAEDELKVFERFSRLELHPLGPEALVSSVLEPASMDFLKLLM